MASFSSKLFRSSVRDLPEKPQPGLDFHFLTCTFGQSKTANQTGAIDFRCDACILLCSLFHML